MVFENTLCREFPVPAIEKFVSNDFRFVESKTNIPISIYFFDKFK